MLKVLVFGIPFSVDPGHWGVFVLLLVMNSRSCTAMLRSYRPYSCSTQLSMKFIILINVKMLTIVGILAFIIIINTKYEFESKKNLYCTSFYLL